MHPHQSDNLLVLKGIRFVDIYSMKTNEPAKFEVGPDDIKLDGELIYQWGHVNLAYHVFHKIITGGDVSAPINFANYTENINMETNFNIYELNLNNGDFSVLRKGALEQNQ